MPILPGASDARGVIAVRELSVFPVTGARDLRMVPRRRSRTQPAAAVPLSAAPQPAPCAHSRRSLTRQATVCTEKQLHYLERMLRARPSCRAPASCCPPRGFKKPATAFSTLFQKKKKLKCKGDTSGTVQLLNASDGREPLAPLVFTTSTRRNVVSWAWAGVVFVRLQLRGSSQFFARPSPAQAGGVDLFVGTYRAWHFASLATRQGILKAIDSRPPDTVRTAVSRHDVIHQQGLDPYQDRVHEYVPPVRPHLLVRSASHCGLPRTVQLVLLVRRANSDKEHAFSHPRDHGDVARTAHPELTVWCLQSVPSRRTASR